MVYFSLHNSFGRAASSRFALLASGYPLHHLRAFRFTHALRWFRYYPSRSRRKFVPSALLSGALASLANKNQRHKAFISFFSRVYKVATAVRALFAAHEEYKYKTKPNHAA
jgi:hypothetical protein